MVSSESEQFRALGYYMYPLEDVHLRTALEDMHSLNFQGMMTKGSESRYIPHRLNLIEIQIIPKCRSFQRIIRQVLQRTLLNRRALSRCIILQVYLPSRFGNRDYLSNLYRPSHRPKYHYAGFDKCLHGGRKPSAW